MLMELVLRPLDGGPDTRFALMSEDVGMCHGDENLAALEARLQRARRAPARTRWRSMTSLPVHIDMVRDLEHDPAACSTLDLGAIEHALRRDWPPFAVPS